MQYASEFLSVLLPLRSFCLVFACQSGEAPGRAFGKERRNGTFHGTIERSINAKRTHKKTLNSCKPSVRKQRFLQTLTNSQVSSVAIGLEKTACIRSYPTVHRNHSDRSDNQPKTDWRVYSADFPVENHSDCYLRRKFLTRRL